MVHRNLVAAIGAALATAASPLSLRAQDSAFVTVSGHDTAGYEQFGRTGNVIKGVWILQRAGVIVHDYSLTLGADDAPTRFTMRVTNPGAPTPPPPQTFTVDFDRDSATFSASGDSAYTNRVALKDAYPFLGQSVATLELPLTRLRRAHVDSTIIVVSPVTGGGAFGRMSVKFVGADSAVFAGAIRVNVAPNGTILGVKAGPVVWQRATPTDINEVIRRFIATGARQSAAEVAAQAARVEVPIAPAELDKFVGEYAFSTTVSAFVTRVGDHLAFRLGPQASSQLYAESPTNFFMRTVNARVEFVLSPTGEVTALDFLQAGARQRAARKP